MKVRPAQHALDKMNPAHEYDLRVDSIAREEWESLLGQFADANIYQTWPYEEACHPKSKVSRLTVRNGGVIVGVAQARIVELPLIRRGVAYIRWPLWRRRENGDQQENLRQCLRAIRQEYVVRRKLAVRIRFGPLIEGGESIQQVLAEEGFRYVDRQPAQHTIMMDITPSLDDLHKDLHQSWRRSLNKARKLNQKLIVGEDPELFTRFEPIYSAMVERKRFDSRTSISSYRRIQEQLPKKDRMTVILCENGGAGALISSMGETGLYIFGASNGVGLKDNSSYLVHWRAVEFMKERGCRNYNLNGTNPVVNPGGYRFKRGLSGKNGKEIRYPGQFEAASDPLSRLATGIGFRLLGTARSLMKTARSRDEVAG